MSKTRIIYFQQNSAIGACEEYFYLLMEGLDKSRFEAIFFCPDGIVLDPLAKRIESLDIKVHRYSSETGNFRLILSLRSSFQRLKPDLIHFNDPCLLGIIAGHLAGAPVLLMTHHTPEYNPNYNFKAKLLKELSFRHLRLYCIFTSEYDRDTGIKKDKIPQDRSFVIYYGLSSKKFNQRYDKKEIYQEFSLNEDCRVVGNIARLDQQKGQIYLIEAAPLVIEKYKSVKFFFIGKGELESELKTLVKEKGLQDYFIFTGHREDICRLLSVFEMLVMPSLYEGLCFAVIEASAMRVPVIATSVGGMRSSVANGLTGLLIPPQDPKALAGAMLWMLEHPREAKDKGIAGRKYFEEMFTQERMLKVTEKVYENLIAKALTEDQ